MLDLQRQDKEFLDSEGRILHLLLVLRNSGSGMQVQPQASGVWLEGETGPMPQGSPWRMANLVHSDSVHLEEPGQHKHSLL